MNKKNIKELFLWNLTDKEIVIPDLAAMVPPRKCINLYNVPYITNELIEKSIKEGSIKKREKFLKFGGPPHVFNKEISVSKTPMIRPLKGGITLSNERNEEGFQIEEERRSEMEFVEQILAMEEDEEEGEELWQPKKK